jgi:hypothetical protein
LQKESFFWANPFYKLNGVIQRWFFPCGRIHGAIVASSVDGGKSLIVD